MNLIENRNEPIDQKFENIKPETSPVNSQIWQEINANRESSQANLTTGARFEVPDHLDIHDPFTTISSAARAFATHEVDANWPKIIDGENS